MIGRPCSFSSACNIATQIIAQVASNQYGAQTIQYQVVTLMTTNEQATFVTVFMYLGEVRNKKEKNRLQL